MFLEPLAATRGSKPRTTLRSDPAADQGRCAWAQMVGINFGRAGCDEVLSYSMILTGLHHEIVIESTPAIR